MYALQATTNSTFGNQTFGITTRTLNCQETKFVKNEKAINFVNANLDALSNEAALGEGEYLDTLAELLNVEDANKFKANLRANYLAIYNSSSVVGAEVLDRALILKFEKIILFLCLCIFAKAEFYYYSKLSISESEFKELLKISQDKKLYENKI